jgi:dephospho-CoA kinase
MGAGKSHVARLLVRLGFPVYNSDLRAKTLLETDIHLREALSAAFGFDLYDKDGRLQRKVLAERAFPSAEATARLNGLVHPAVGRDFEVWCTHQLAAGHRLVFKEAALIYEAATQGTLDAVWLVAAPVDIRRQRVYTRDKLTAQEVDDRMARQWAEERKRELANFVIENDGIQPLAPQLRRAFQLLNKASENTNLVSE